jgi:hypothetical protein
MLVLLLMCRYIGAPHTADRHDAGHSLYFSSYGAAVGADAVAGIGLADVSHGLQQCGNLSVSSFYAGSVRYFGQCGLYSNCSTIGAMGGDCFDHVCNREDIGFKLHLIALQTIWIARAVSLRGLMRSSSNEIGARDVRYEQEFRLLVRF